MPSPSLPLSFDPAGIQLDPAKGLSRQLYQALRQRVLDGRLGSGSRLPASRDLANALGISRNSVVRAYDQLYAEGFIEGRIGDGTYVAQLPGKALFIKKLSTKVSTGFSTGLPTGLSTKSAETAGVTSSKVKRLRGLIAAYLRSSRGLSCSAEQIVITCGAQQGISLCAQLLVDPGEGVAVENPGYRAARLAFAVAGARVQGVAVDQDGLDCVALGQLPDCRLVYVTPSHQYPTGVVMSLARRLELLAWAERTGGWIVEDDYDGEYRYSGAPLAPLAALDRQGRVLYIGTFGKIAFPALRLGYLVLPPTLVAAFAQRRALDMRHSEVSTQVVMAEFMAAGHFQRHIRRMRRAALSRRNTLLAHWPTNIRGCGSLPEAVAGLHLMVPVQSLAREQELITQAASVGVEISPLSSFWLTLPEPPAERHAGLVLGFAAVPEVDIVAALKRLREVWLA